MTIDSLSVLRLLANSAPSLSDRRLARYYIEHQDCQCVFEDIVVGNTKHCRNEQEHKTRGPEQMDL